jgi:hypothetical protein
MPKTNLRVVVFCLTLEIKKPLKAFEYYKPDKVYMLGMTKGDVYADFRAEIEKQMPKSFKYQYQETTVYDFTPCLNELLKIIRGERKEGNHVYVDITGPPAYSAAAMVAAMMETATPFFSGTKEYVASNMYFYDGKTPIGMSKEVWDPLELPTFHIERPDDKLVKGLRVWNDIKKQAGLTTDTRIIKALAGEKLMDKIFNPSGSVSQNAKMLYRRQFLDKWLKNGWVVQTSRGKYELTEAGAVALRVFE